MKFYIHAIKPHCSGTMAETYFNGWKFGIWEHPYPAIEPQFYRFQSQHITAAKDVQQKAEVATNLISYEEQTGKVRKYFLEIAADEMVEEESQ